MKGRSVLGIAVVLVVVVAVAVIIMVQTGEAQKPSGQGNVATDPQMLMIPRWFLLTLTLDGKKADVAVGQQTMTLQFAPDGTINGTGGCNSFGGSYAASADGKMHFDKMVSTMMACDAMDTESAYLGALAKVETFKIVDGRLLLSSADGQTTLVFVKPPK